MIGVPSDGVSARILLTGCSAVMRIQPRPLPLHTYGDNGDIR
jgi:hypothetical protein